MAVETKLQQEQRGWKVTGTLLDGATGDTNGTWVPLHRVHPLCVTVEGDISATLTVYVSNAPSKPSDSDNDRPVLGSTLSGAGSVTIDAPYNWGKVRVASYGSGTGYAYVVSGKPGPS